MTEIGAAGGSRAVSPARGGSKETLLKSFSHPTGPRASDQARVGREFYWRDLRRVGERRRAIFAALSVPEVDRFLAVRIFRWSSGAEMVRGLEDRPST